VNAIGFAGIAGCDAGNNFSHAMMRAGARQKSRIIPAFAQECLLSYEPSGNRGGAVFIQPLNCVNAASDGKPREIACAAIISNSS
jgi:hypothetical protein